MKYDISKTEPFSTVIAKFHCGSAREGETKTNKGTMTTATTIMYKNKNNNKIRTIKEPTRFS